MGITAPLPFRSAPHAPSPQHGRVIASSAVAALGAAELGALVAPSAGLAGMVPVAPSSAGLLALSNVLVLCVAAATFAVSRGLWRGRRTALEAAVVGALAIGLGAIAAGGTVWGVVGGFAAISLLAGHRLFPRGRARPYDRHTASLIILAAVAGIGMYGLLAVPPLVADRVAGVGPAFAQAASKIVSGRWWLEQTSPLAIGLDVLMALTLGCAAAWLYALLRPGAALDGHAESDHRRARAIVDTYCADSLDPFALREDKAFHFHGGGFLSYRTLRGTAVVSGDPIGPAGSAAAILADFMVYASERDWDVVITGASERYLEEYRALGLRSMKIGEEAVVDPRTFTLEGRAIRKVRQSVTRIERRGWSIECLRGEQLDSELAAGLAAIEEQWRAAQPRIQGFAMTLGRLWGAPGDEDALYVVARDPDGEVASFMRFETFRGGLSLDVTRRLGAEPNGLAEAMVVATLGWARDHDLTAVSLNFAGFSHLMSGDAVLDRRQQLMRRLLRATHGRFQLERLMAFCSKFGPAWRARYLVYGSRTQLPRAGLRVLQAEAYVRPPRSRPAPGRWLPLPEAGAPIAAAVPVQAMARELVS